MTVWTIPALARVVGVLGAMAAAHYLPASAQARVAVHLHGTVTDSATGAAIAGAAVTASSSAQVVVTDAAGRYEFLQLRPGAVELRVRMVGYEPRALRLSLSAPEHHTDVVLVQRPIELPSIVAAAIEPVAASRAVTTMTRGDLQRMRGQTLGETIKELPGVAVIQQGPSIAKPVIRGLHSQRVVVTNGGVRQEGQQWGTEHAPEVDSFDADELRVVRGAGTVLHGSDALGGVVVIERPPPPADAPVRGALDLNAFSNNRQAAASLSLETGALRAPAIGPLGVRLRVTGRKAGDAHSPSYNLRNTGFEELGLTASVGVHRGWGTSDLLVSRFDTELGIYTGAHVGNFDDLQRAMSRPPRSTEFSYTIDPPRQRVTHDLVTWRTTLASSPLGPASVQYGFQRNQRRELDNHGPLSTRGTPAFDLRLYTHTVDLRASHDPRGPFRGTVGASVIRQGNVSEGRAFLIPEYRLYSGSVYALEELELGRWTVSAGARIDHLWQRTYRYADAGITSPNSSRRWTDVSGSVGAAYALGGGWSVTGRLSRGWRPPNVNERFSQGVHHGSAQYELGDPTLRREKTVGTDIGVRHAGGAVALELTLFDNRIDGFIYLRPRAPVFTIRGAFPGYEYAQDDARLRGVELLASSDPLSWLEVRTSATLVRGSFRETEAPLYDMPADRASLSVRAFRGAAERERYIEVGIAGVRRQDRVPDETVYTLPSAGYALVNVEAGASAIRLLGRTLDFTLGIRNLFDRRYRDYLSRYRLFADDVGRDVVLRLRLPLFTP